MKGFKIEFVVPQAAVEPLAAAIADHCVAIAAFETVAGGDRWRVEGYADEDLDRAAAETALALAAAAAGIAPPAMTIDPLPDRDWLAENRASFKPLRVGRYFVYPSHHEDLLPSGTIGLCIDAGIAFGSGEHASTQGCLAAMDRLARRRRMINVLDMGAGSGILALAAAATWRCPVLAADIDAGSVVTCAQNARDNGLANLVTSIQSQGYRHRLIRRRGPYDLILANILARPLTRMARAAAGELAPGGHIVLAGLLTSQAPMVETAYRRQGLILRRRLPVAEWTTLMFQRPNGR